MSNVNNLTDVKIYLDVNKFSEDKLGKQGDIMDDDSITVSLNPKSLYELEENTCQSESDVDILVSAQRKLSETSLSEKESVFKRPYPIQHIRKDNVKSRLGIEEKFSVYSFPFSFEAEIMVYNSLKDGEMPM